MQILRTIHPILLCVGILLCGCGGGEDTVSNNNNPGPVPPLVVAPALNTVAPGQTAIYSVTLQPATSITNVVVLNAAGLSNNVTAVFDPPQIAFNPNVASATSTLTVTTDAATPPGSYPLTVEGRIDNVVFVTAQATLNVQPDTGQQNFTLSVTPQSAVVTPNAPALFNITVTPNGGFSEDVTLSVSGGSGDINIGAPTPGVVRPVNQAPTNATLQVTLAPGAMGSLPVPVTITASSGTVTQSVTITVQPQP